MARLIPYGICNFKKVMVENFYYVDKTRYIEKLEKFQAPVFLRPRRFGKSLFTETLRWYYDIKAAGNFNEIFGTLYVGKNPTPLKNSYFFLSLDFSAMSVYSEEDPDFVRKQFNNKIISRLEAFLDYYKELLNIDATFIRQFRDDYKEFAHSGLKAAVEIVAKVGGKVYLVIDEYDSFTNAMAINYIHAPEEQNEYLNITRKGGFFRSFFEAVKDSTRTALDRVYITGILPITISDMNSGFNIARWITHENEFSDMLGITESELDILLDDVYRDYPSITMPVDQVKHTLKEYYNGYRFVEGGELVYNPMMTLYYLDNISRNNSPPRIMADQNIRVQYDQMSYIFGKNISKRDSVLQEISEKRALRFSVQPGRMFDLNDYKSGTYINECLYYLGLLFHTLSMTLSRQMYEVLPEYNLPNGTVDLMVKSLKHPGAPVPLVELIEIKRVPKSATDAEFKAQFEKAKEQAAKYPAGDYKAFRTTAICFRGNRDYLLESLPQTQ